VNDDQFHDLVAVESEVKIQKQRIGQGCLIKVAVALLCLLLSFFVIVPLSSSEVLAALAELC
jgi:hypothetical protein